MTSRHQEFKKFEKMFSAKEIAECRKRWLYNGSSHSEREGYTKWSHEVKQWAQSDVQHAVYRADDHMEWQLFRVSLKGLTTSEKLYMLDNRCAIFLHDDDWDLQKCRIDNYIGALVRGGQLSTTYEVLK